MASRDSEDKVPGIDVATNSHVQDVVGNKSDTVGGTSLISIAKQNAAAIASESSDVTDIKAVTDLIPDGGAMTSIAQEATIGTPAGADVSTDIAAIKSDSGAIKTVTDALPDAGALTSIAQDATVAKEATLGTPAGADLATDIAAVKSDSGAIKTVTDALPDAGALTSIAQESTLGTPAGADLATDIAAIDAFHDVPTADSADNLVISDVVGNKTDTVGGDSLMALLKQLKAYIQGSVSSGTLSYLDAGGTQDIVEVTTSDKKHLIRGILVDCDNLTQDGTLALFVKVDGTNYREVANVAFTVASDDSVLLDANLITDKDFKFTWTEGGDEGAARNIPFKASYQVLE